VLVQEGYTPKAKTIAMKAMATTLSKPGMYKRAGKIGRWMIRKVPGIVNNKLNPWYKQRDMPDAPKQSFRDWYEQNKKK
jgi:L-lactate dehydrogenase complex protein LldF